MLEVTNITAARSEYRLFQGLSFQVRPRQIVHVRGPNGAGKTTLLRLLCGLVRPDDGQILWDGIPISERLPEFFRALVYIGHENGMKADLTARENLHFAQRVTGAPAGLDPLRALETLGARALADIPCRFLSAGQKRRVTLARLLTSNARLWLLDEPFAALDESARAVVSDLVAEHMQSGGMCVATSHQPLDCEQFEAREINLGAKS